MKKKVFSPLLAAAILWVSCRKDNVLVPPTDTAVETPSTPVAVKGFYLLNEGNMGSNKCTLDYFDAETGVYSENIFAAANPGAVKELGDVGNDIQVYGSKLYAVINVSNKVEVMAVGSAKKIGQLDVSNCRYITFHKGKGYISSYAGPVQIDPNARAGEVVEFDTATLSITRRVTVGYQPEELAVSGNRLFVANSGGYRFPDYDRTVSVVDLESFKEVKKIDVAINLHRLKKGSNGLLYVSSRGDYYDVPSRLFVLDPTLDKVTDTFHLPAGNFVLKGDSAYVISSEWDWSSGASKISYNLVNLRTGTATPNGFITDGTAQQIQVPYGLAINPETGDIYLTDAKDYVSPGTLYCFDKTGKLKWRVTTGDIPAHIAFVMK